MPLVESIQALITNSSHSPIILMMGVILLSYLLEDLAIVTSSGLAVEGLLPPSLALLAIFIGIATGDLGLYYLGKSGGYFRGIRYRALTNRNFKRLRNRFRKNAFTCLFIIRFVPGLRTVGFTLSGFFSIPIFTFLSAVIGATALWTGFVFSIIFYLGRTSWLQASEHQWLVLPFAVLLLFTVNKLINRTYLRGKV